MANAWGNDSNDPFDSSGADMSWAKDNDDPWGKPKDNDDPWGKPQNNNDSWGQPEDNHSASNVWGEPENNQSSSSDWGKTKDNHASSDAFASGGNDDWASEPDPKKQGTPDWESPEPIVSSSGTKNNKKSSRWGSWGKKKSDNLSAPDKVRCAKRLITISGVPLYISYAWIIMFAVWVGLCFKQSGGFFLFLTTLALFPITFLTHLLHEGAHSLMGKILGAQTIYIVSVPLGGQHFIESNNGNFGKFLIALAGPISHLPHVFLWYYCTTAVGGTWDHVHGWGDPTNIGLNICGGMTRVNLELLFFNLVIPSWPLDGSLMFTIIFGCCLSPDTMAVIMSVVNIICGIGLIVFGALQGFGFTVYAGVLITWNAIKLFRLRFFTNDQNKLLEYGPFAIVELLPGSGISSTTTSV